MKIFKSVATGNDFLIVDLLGTPNSVKAELRAEKARRWCERHNGIGADGMVFIEKKEGYDFAWDFYNSDGSVAEMCGNAARAVGLYAGERLGKKELKFSTRVGATHARLLSHDQVEVRLPKIADAQWNQLLQWQGSTVNFDFVRAGVPHAVVRVPKLELTEELRGFARQLKMESRFQPESTNVTFIRPRSDSEVESCTFERGVEDFTLSCGTGAVAAAYSLLRGEENHAVQVRVPGGELSVIWKEGQPLLSGEARIVAEIGLTKEF